MTEYDSPWKEFLDAFLEPFIEFGFPDLHGAIDWSEPIVALDKELQQIAPISDAGMRTVDKLVEVRLLDGDSKWLLIHMEVQSQRIEKFADRMFVYYYRIRDKYDKPLVSLAVLGDNHLNWRPNCFTENQFGCRVEFHFPILKLLDYQDSISDLESSDNVFATMVLVHLLTQQTAGDPVSREKWKLRVMRSLYNHGKSRDEIRQMFRVIDWMMDLPPDLAVQFRTGLEQIEEEKNMPYVTSIERLAKEEGREEGILIGQILLLQKQLGAAAISKPALESMSLPELNGLLDQLLTLADNVKPE